MNLEYATHNGHSGFLSHVPPTNKLAAPTSPQATHMDRILWVTSQIEMPAGWGQIQNCQDGAVMSAGLLHHIAVLPGSLEQGSLWPLVRRMVDRATLVDTTDPVTDLYQMILAKGWILGVDGYLRVKVSGAKVSGQDIRTEITQSADGNVPPSGPGFDKARLWALRFADAFACETTRQVQMDYAAEWFLSSYTSAESRAYVRMTGDPGITSEAAAHRALATMATHVDLAMVVYHSFSANAPGKARAVLDDILATALNGTGFSAELIKRIGTSSYANWAHRADGNGRYDRTRSTVIKLGVYAPGLVAGSMPVDP